MRLYGFAALFAGIALIVCLLYLSWTGRWDEVDPLYTACGLLLVWFWTLMDARGTIGDLNRDIGSLRRRVDDLTQELRDERTRGARYL